MFAIEQVSITSCPFRRLWQTNQQTDIVVYREVTRSKDLQNIIHPSPVLQLHFLFFFSFSSFFFDYRTIPLFRECRHIYIYIHIFGSWQSLNWKASWWRQSNWCGWACNPTWQDRRNSRRSYILHEVLFSFYLLNLWTKFDRYFQITLCSNLL